MKQGRGGCEGHNDKSENLQQGNPIDGEHRKAVPARFRTGIITNDQSCCYNGISEGVW